LFKTTDNYLTKTTVLLLLLLGGQFEMADGGLFWPMGVNLRGFSTITPKTTSLPNRIKYKKQIARHLSTKAGQFYQCA